jgi:fibronectin-binding autotransporter adhesin
MKRLFPVVCLFSLLIAGHSFAGSATWNLNPTSGDWSTATNWTPATVPNGPNDTATFGASSISNLLLSSTAEVDEIVYDPSASPYTISTSSLLLTISGVGITNNSGIDQHFVLGNYGGVFFTGNATAGSQTSFTNVGSTTGQYQPGSTTFFDSTNAGSGTFINNAADVIFGPAGQTFFFDQSSAGNGSFVCSGSAVDGAPAGWVDFTQGTTAANATFVINAGQADGGAGGYVILSADAGTATFTINGGNVAGAKPGTVNFAHASTAKNATLIANTGRGGARGGIIFFVDDSRGGNARVEVFGNGSLDITGHDSTGVTIGSLEGDGLVYLGRKNLSVGSNRLNTSFAGVIDGTGGSLTKLGSGRLRLSNASTYTGGTIVSGGKLLVNNASGSGVGTGILQVNKGTLGGKGIIAGAVTVGIGDGADAMLAPGGNGTNIGGLTLQSLLTFGSNATYQCGLNSDAGTADQILAMGVTIDSAQLSVTDLGKTALAAGTTFAVISNTSAAPITGTFSNLPDGATIIAGNNTYQANYEGGDGNDLTLTVVP